ncbi:amino acid adenylation protein [Bradyrhizobium oligotrophicum S58]|uniref:Amino acid adenylation protein n=2 Tax=Bradyrhizobium oligotrophicum TaxID=44255 RepID=M5A2P8_9BRAD|nr:amino acid adenylation protein [Bradyrhizobium oligotrophicum S58]
MANLFEWLGTWVQVSHDYDAGFLQFMLALATGGLIVVLFAMNDFGAMPIGGADNVVAKFPTRILASRDELKRAMIVYVTAMIVALVALSVLGPAALKIGGFTPPAALVPVLPLLIALILVGAIRRVGYLEQIERNLGQFARERAYIPAATLAIADKMAAAEFDFAPYQDGAMLALPAMAGVEQGDFTRPRGSLEYGWARLCVLSYELDAGRSATLVGLLGNPVLQTLETERQTLADDVVEYRAQLRLGRSYSAAQLQARIRETLRAYHILLAGAVRRGLAPGADVTLALVRLGFLCAESQQPVSERGNLIIGGLGVMAASVLVLVMAAAGLSGWWHASRNFPASAPDAFLWCLSAVSAHGAAILLADRVRTRALARGRWYRRDAHGPISPLANLIRVGIVCGFGGYAVLVSWGAMYQEIVTPALLKGMAAYAMMPATTGAFYAFALDNVELHRRPPRWLEITLQACATAFFGLLACSAWFALVGDDPRTGYDLVILVTLFGAVIGGSLGWYIPAGVQQDPHDPLAEVRIARVHKLEEVARSNFGDAKAAQQWLEGAFVQLGGRTPRAAACEGVDGYDDAVGLLNNPQERIVV